MRYIIIMAMLLTVVSCQKKQKDISAQQLSKFIKTYQSYLAFAASDTAKFENRGAYLDSALAKNKYTHQEFDSVLKSLGKNPDEMVEFVNEFADSLKTMMKRPSKKDLKESQTKN